MSIRSNFVPVCVADENGLITCLKHLKNMSKQKAEEGRRLSVLEVFLIEIVAYTLVWLVNDYIGSLLSLIMAGIFLSIFILSLLAELIERSKVPRWYYWMMVVSFLAPLIVSGFFILLGKGQLTWLQ